MGGRNIVVEEVVKGRREKARGDSADKSLGWNPAWTGLMPSNKVYRMELEVGRGNCRGRKDQSRMTSAGTTSFFPLLNQLIFNVRTCSRQMTQL